MGREDCSSKAGQWSDLSTHELRRQLDALPEALRRVDRQLVPELSAQDQAVLDATLRDMDESLQALPENSSRRLQIRYEQAVHSDLFAAYLSDYRRARDDVLELLPRRGTVPASPEALAEGIGGLSAALAHCILLNVILVRKRRFAVCRNGESRFVEDTATRRFSMSVSAAHQVITTASIEPDDVLVDLFSGSGNLTAFLSLREYRALYAIDINYQLPPRAGRLSYAVRLNAASLLEEFSSLPEILRPRFNDVVHLCADSAALPLKSGCASKVFADPPYGRARIASCLSEAEDEVSAWMLFVRSLHEIHRVLKPRGSALCVVPIEWAQVLEELCVWTPDDVVSRRSHEFVVAALRSAPHYTELGNPWPERDCDPTVWARAMRPARLLAPGDGRPGLTIGGVETVRPTYRSPLCVLHLRRT